GTAQVSIGGTVTEVAAGDVDEARAQVVAIVAARAEQLGRPLHVLTRDPAGEWPLIIHPDQTVTEDDSREARPQAPEPAAEPAPQ
ncbi:hypothetical protein, partial [Cognatiluteimonas profundi]